MAPAKVTTKGDMAIGTGSNTIDRFGVGTNRQLLRYDSAQTLGMKWSDDAVPAGLISLFTGACPTGWSDYTTARGRAIVGTPSGGTNAGTVGTALTNLQDKTHTHTGPSHRHTIVGDAHDSTGSAVRSMFNSVPETLDGGTAATGTSATSGSLPYIQLRFCSKD